jgi:drug/metabolite transporter (DMT)-like permease
VPAWISSPRGRVAAALAVVWIVWGSTYVAMRVGVRALPPLTISGVRFLIAGLLLYGWCAVWRRRHPDAGFRSPGLREWRASAILGLALPAAGTGGATWAEQKLPAGTTALLLASIPVWLVLSSRIADGERITRIAGLGLALGLAGVAVLVNPFSGGAPDPLASAVALGGALSWGCGSVYAKRAPHPGQPLLGSGMQLICAGAALTVAGAATGELGRIHASALASASSLALGYLIIFGSLIAYTSYEWLIRHAPSQLVGTYAFINPVVAVLLGWLLLGEPVSARTLLAAAVIVAGVALIVLRRPPAEPSGEDPHRNDDPHREAPARGPEAPPLGQEAPPRGLDRAVLRQAAPDTVTGRPPARYRG